MISEDFKRLTNIDVDFDEIVNGSMRIYPFELFECLKYGMIPHAVFKNLTKLIQEKLIIMRLESIGEIVNQETIDIGFSCFEKEIKEAIEKELTKSFMKHVKDI